MKCADAAEFVSALCDCETIRAPLHIGECEVCRTLLKEYAEIGASRGEPRTDGRGKSARLGEVRKGWFELVAERMGYHADAKICLCIAVGGDRRDGFNLGDLDSARVRREQC
jgi:hypothetical protein